MGAYGTPEHLPNGSNEPQYQYGYNQPDRKDIIHGNLKAWQKAILILYLCFVGIFAIVMFTSLSGYAGSKPLGAISTIAFFTFAILFAINVNKHKRAWPLILCSAIAFIVYFGAMGSSQVQTSPPPMQAANAAAVSEATNTKSSSPQSSSTKAISSAAPNLNPESFISKATYDKLKTGMTYEATAKLLGSPGKETSESGEKGSEYFVASYLWKNDDNTKLVQITFIGNKLSVKTEYNLE